MVKTVSLFPKIHLRNRTGHAEYQSTIRRHVRCHYRDNAVVDTIEKVRLLYREICVNIKHNTE